MEYYQGRYEKLKDRNKDNGRILAKIRRKIRQKEKELAEKYYQYLLKTNFEDAIDT